MLYCMSQIYNVGSLIPTTQAQIVLVSRVSMTDAELTHTHPIRWEEWTIYSIFLRGKTAKVCLYFLLMAELARVMMISLPGGWSLITLFHTGVRRDLTPMCNTTHQPWICVPLPGLHHAGNKQPSDVLPSKETRKTIVVYCRSRKGYCTGQVPRWQWSMSQENKHQLRK